MNPPYDGNIHLLIIGSVLSHLSDSESMLINLSPVRWLQDPLAEYKQLSDYVKFKDSVASHIISIDVISALDAQLTFNIVCNMDLGVYTLSLDVSKSFTLVDSLVRRIIAYSQVHKPVIDDMKKDGWRVRVPKITAGRSGGKGIKNKSLMSFGALYVFYNGKKDGKPWYDFYQKNQFTKTTDDITWSIRFNSELEAFNFIKSLDTDFGKWYTDNVLIDVHVIPEQILWVGDSLNKRTGKKGYLSEWTSDDLKNYFESL